MRKSPVRHQVLSYKKSDGTTIHQYLRGHGQGVWYPHSKKKLADPSLPQTMPSERDIIEIVEHLEAERKPISVIAVVNVLRNQGWHVTSSLTYNEKLRDKIRSTLETLEAERSEDNIDENLETKEYLAADKFGKSYTNLTQKQKAEVNKAYKSGK